MLFLFIMLAQFGGVYVMRPETTLGIVGVCILSQALGLIAGLICICIVVSLYEWRERRTRRQ